MKKQSNPMPEGIKRPKPPPPPPGQPPHRLSRERPLMRVIKVTSCRLCPNLSFKIEAKLETLTPYCMISERDIEVEYAPTSRSQVRFISLDEIPVDCPLETYKEN